MFKRTAHRRRRFDDDTRAFLRIASGLIALEAIVVSMTIGLGGIGDMYRAVFGL
ncbi:hypothetical protein NJL88_11550 [Streptomyces sp. DK15]|uniref:hypothetical protein n=1 Tax=Streptomyces sp. DK15 TaxID=2957499 RepID=UPI0029B32F4F|nr:hypothetical protein [Streptomyces sp. DK15]MDX2390688.1 hypothetical protein [Streptomyces sp. DK15]